MVDDRVLTIVDVVWTDRVEKNLQFRSQRPAHLETADDRGLFILDIAPTDRIERTYNLTVSGPHTFLVGEDGAVVHNCKWFNLNYLPPALRQQVLNALSQIRSDTLRGATFRNWNGTLPTGVSYTRYTVGSQSGPVRIVTGGGNTYVTFDHYATFFRILTLPLQTRPPWKLGWTGNLEGNHAPEALHAGGDRREVAAG